MKAAKSSGEPSPLWLPTLRCEITVNRAKVKPEPRGIARHPHRLRRLRYPASGSLLWLRVIAQLVCGGASSTIELYALLTANAR